MVSKKKHKNTSIINGSFDDIIKASVSGNPAPKKKVSAQDKLKVMQTIHKHLIKKSQGKNNQ